MKLYSGSVLIIHYLCLCLLCLCVFEGEPANYAEYFEIDSISGNVSQLKPVRHSEIPEFRITLQVRTRATEEKELITLTKYLDSLPIQSAS